MARSDKGGPKRSAIYTRKSSEEGLDQSFNSLHAQSQACEAFVRESGWRVLAPDQDGIRRGWVLGRDDGATGPEDTARPRKGKRIDVVVVYKVDRLTPLAGRLRQDRRDLRRSRRVVRGGHPAVQYHHLDGPIDSERAAVFCPVRARSYWRAHPRQDRGLQAEGNVDGRHAAAGLRPARSLPRGKRSRSPRLYA